MECEQKRNMNNRTLYLSHGLIIILICSVAILAGYAQGDDPQLIISQHEYSICSGTAIEADIIITGTPPVALINRYNGNTDTVVSNTNHVYLTFDVPGTCLITGYKDFSTPIIPVSESINIDAYPSPEVEFEGGGFICDTNQFTPLVAHFQGIPPFTLAYLINGTPDTLVTNSFSYTFDLPYDFQIITQQISDMNCTREVIDTAYLFTGDIPAPQISGDTLVCAGNTRIYSTNNDMYTGEWSIPGVAIYSVDSESDGSFVTVTWTVPGDYSILLKLVNHDSGCESAQTSLPVTVHAAPLLTGETDTSVCFGTGGDLIIEIATKLGDIVYWPSLEHTGASITINQEGTYSYVQTNIYGCSDSGSFVVINSCAPALFVPEAFTPNGDGINDYLILFGTYYNLDFSVYSPSGLLLFRSVNEQVMWDGTCDGNQVPDGSYYWHAGYYDTLGTKHVLSGIVTIIR
jgi:gliding motility-associated-like protein